MVHACPVAYHRRATPYPAEVKLAESADQPQAVEPEAGRSGQPPQRLLPGQWKAVLRSLWRDLNENHVPLTAAGVTFFILLALVPTLNCFVAIYGLFNSPAAAAQQTNLLTGIVPGGGLAIIKDQLVRLATQANHSLGLTLIVSAVIALWSAAAGFRALFEAMNVAYHETETRGFIRVNLMALAATIASAIAAAVVLTAVLFVPVILGVFPIADAFLDGMVRVLAYLAMLAVYVTGIAALYRWGPSRSNARWRWLGPGNILAISGTVAASLLFSWYAGNFGNYASTYGSLGALIAFLTWLWMSVTIIILGASLNAELERRSGHGSSDGANEAAGMPRPSARAHARARNSD